MKVLFLYFQKLKTEFKILVSSKSHSFLKIVQRFSIFAQRMLTSAKLWEPANLLVHFFKSSHVAVSLYQISCFYHTSIQRYGPQAKMYPKPTRNLKNPGLIGLTRVGFSKSRTNRQFWKFYFKINKY